MARTIGGLFPDRMTAERAMVALQNAGFDPDQMGLVSRETPLRDPPLREKAMKSTVGAVIGSLIGGTVGAIIAIIISSIAFGTSHSIVGGITAASVAGGIIGWLLGGLATRGVPVEEAEYRQERVESGRMMLTVNGAGRDAEAQRIMRENGAEGFQRPQGMSRSSRSDTTTPPIPQS